MKKPTIIICLALIAGLLAGCTSSIPPEGASAQRETPVPVTEVPAARETEAPVTEAPAARETEAPETEAPAVRETETPETETPGKTEIKLNVPETGMMSDMTDDRIFALLDERGVEYSSEIRNICRVHELAARFEKDPYTPVILDHIEYALFIEEVRQAVLDYYGLEDQADVPPYLGGN